jgi:hypothetical protein
MKYCKAKSITFATGAEAVAAAIRLERGGLKCKHRDHPPKCYVSSPYQVWWDWSNQDWGEDEVGSYRMWMRDEKTHVTALLLLQLER